MRVIFEIPSIIYTSQSISGPWICSWRSSSSAKRKPRTLRKVTALRIRELCFSAPEDADTGNTEVGLQTGNRGVVSRPMVRQI